MIRNLIEDPRIEVLLQARLQKRRTSLKGFQKFLRRLGDPHLNLPPTIHIAGTNGKGSVLSFLKSMLQTAKYTVHTYTSPHLIHLNERVMLAGTPIDQQILNVLLHRVLEASADNTLSFFEIMTATAFLAFSKYPADILLLEAGLGGRLDPTNVIVNPICSVITSISQDHTELLGETLGNIAQEKAGIIKPYRPVITIHQNHEVIERIFKTAQIRHAPFYQVYPRADLQGVKLGLPGLHQVTNASLAFSILDILTEFKVSTQARHKGLETVSWPGRLQRLDKNKWELPKDCELWVDGAHNTSAALQIAATIRQWESKPLYLIVALQQTKDAIAFLKPFKNLVCEVKTLNLEGYNNFYSAEALESTARTLGFTVQSCSNLEHAMTNIKNSLTATQKPSRILICGSLYLVGEVLALENNKSL
ncbi:MAG: bifunctional folylpolyglutamate synthase/dihydrofolate synthase [Alphaproteobacteria bacterium]|nr:bifunctional folylpolyglutamate synthase/dihydrofolate synthase [Alphaproteobacteria bacterium]